MATLARSQLSVVLLIVFALSAGGWAARECPDQASDVPDVFRPLYQGAISSQQLPSLRDSLPCERIALERSGGMIIPSGAFKLSLERAGTATLSTDGGNRFGRSGEYVGSVRIFEFGKLCHLIVRSRLAQMKPRYATNWTDEQTERVTVQTANGVVTVADYGGAGPVELWAIERAIEAVALIRRGSPSEPRGRLLEGCTLQFWGRAA